MKRYYVGRKHGHIGSVVFTAETTPTEQTHGDKFAAVIGPFKTRRGAQFCALFGQGNPHIQTVNDAERLAKQG